MNSLRKFRITNNAPTIVWFAVISFAALILGYITDGESTILMFSEGHNTPGSILTGLRFFTHVLGHSDWNHYISNMTLFLLLGPMLEEKYGRDKILEIIVITALVSGLVNYFLFPYTILCGASGIVFAFVMLTSFTSFKEGEITVTVIIVAVIWIGREIVSGFTEIDSISNLSHIIGGAVGAIIGYKVNIRRKASNYGDK